MGQIFRLFFSEHMGSVGAVFRFFTRFIDVLIAPFLLDTVMLYSYLVARSGTLLIPLALNLLGRKATPKLAALARMDTQLPFQEAAARINLGYLMICGGVAVLVLGVATFAASIAGGLGQDFNDILLWLVIGQSAPVFFGATGLLMHIVNRAAFYDVLQGLTSLMFLGGVFALGVTGGEQLAQTFAAAQLTQAALCAMLLTQCGVWPGLTALLHKQIKLF